MRHVGTPREVLTDAVLSDVSATRATVVEGPGYPPAVHYRA